MCHLAEKNSNFLGGKNVFPCDEKLVYETICERFSSISNEILPLLENVVFILNIKSPAFGNTVKLCYNELGYSKHPVITNKPNTLGGFKLF